MAGEPPDLREPLKRVFGYDAFRPLQEDIIRANLAGRDVFALLPTGGGKSLCYQLPALCRPGLTVVVSPLIALMKDQVDALTAAGVPATFLNSSLSPNEARERFRALNALTPKLLYVAPERVVVPGFYEDLRRWRISGVAIDEAHCISEWGHDFRPEYRQLSTLREAFPDIPFEAFTATATPRVRDDIVEQLRLRDPQIFVASFNRANLTYRVEGKSGAYRQLHTFIARRAKESGIVYCQSRKSAESLAARLSADGIQAAPYHAGLDAATRSRNQEAFLRDDVQVICATIAFGMGINKPNVRFVVHYDLPKNVEGYYQETGRAGRDGLPAECLLLFSPGDAVKYGQFIDQKTDPTERKVARAQLQQMLHYAESSLCRRAELLNYFGEPFHESNCGACDNCLSPRETWDGTQSAQKLLSCVYRIREHSGFGVGLNHVVEVLTGARTDRIRKWGHDTLSTYNIGTELDRVGWAAVGRELIRLGLLTQDAAQFNTLDLTPAGLATLKSRTPITLTRAAARTSEPAPRFGAGGADTACDETLFNSLRALRKQLADARAVPAYIVFSDVALRQMARFYPTTPEAFTRISGVGQRKLAEYGTVFLDHIRQHLETQPRLEFGNARPESVLTPSPASAPGAASAAATRVPGSRRVVLTETVYESLRRFRNGEAVPDIARHRGLAEGTIYGHLATAIEAGERLELDAFFSDEAREALAVAFAKHGFDNLTGTLETAGPAFSIGQLRIYRAIVQQQSRNRATP